MKNKSARHKEDNTFKFQPFAERISHIDVDIFHKVSHKYETLDDDADECHFHQAIEKWDVLNLTESYELFKRDVRAHGIITLPQLIHNKENVVQILLKHLKLKNVLSLQPLLEFVVALAKDLRNDFYPYYPDFLSILIELLNTKDTDQLEWTFQCLAYLFKFLWRALIKDIGTVFKTLFPLLSDNFPTYINNFAAESFAFVARKVKDKASFLALILKAVRLDNDSIPGCGKLLFEVIKGVSGQFHTCADTFLPFLIESLSDDKYAQNELYEILEQIVANIVNEIHPQKVDLLWKTFDDVLNKLEKTWAENATEKIANNIDRVLNLIGQSIEFKGGKFLPNPAVITQQILKILNLDNIAENVQLNTVKIAILLLLSRNVRLTQEQASGLTKKILALKNKTVLLYFIDNSSKYPSFESLILPTFLQYCKETNLDKDCLRVLTQLILRKSPPSEHGINFSTWQKYRIDFQTHNTAMTTIFESYFTKLDYTNLDEYLCGLICLPHLNVPFESFKKMLLIDFNNVAELSDDGISLQRKLFVLFNILGCLVRIVKKEDLVGLKQVLMKNVLPLCHDVENLVALRVMDLYFSAMEGAEQILDETTLTEVHQILETGFNSPYHKVRLLTAHIYALFESTVDFKIANYNEDFNIFSICFRVESIDPQVDTYRDQLQQLEKFNYDKTQISMSQHTLFKTVPLRYLCGALYMNFQLLWEPIVNIIASHGMGMEVNSFWNVYLERLKTATENMRDEKRIEYDVLESQFGFIGDLFQSLYKVEDKPDYFNVRLLLWKAMVQFAEVAERKTRDVSELLLNFMEKEYMRSNSDIAFTWNIKQNSPDETMEVDDDEENDETERIKKELKKPAVKSGGKNNLKLLLQHLTVLSKIRSPKSMYRESELYALYFNLLSHKNSQVQKAALDCIMTYKFKYLTPYQQNLYNLIDDKNFKNELSTFRVDTETSIIQSEHRDELISVVMRIVFSKMVAKTGLRTGGKSSGQFRRNLILRFLAGCKESEKMTFIKMAFKFYDRYLNEDVVIMVRDILNNIDLEKFIPPKRLQSSVNLLTVILEQFGNLMGVDLMRYVLRVIISIGAAIKGALNNVANVHVGYLSILRSLRTSTIKLVEEFFRHFELFPFTGAEIDTVFDVFIWPYLEKLNIEGIHSPTTLLKLLCLFGNNPRYFNLLVKYTGEERKYPLQFIMQLLLNPKSHASVANLIMEMIEKLLSLTIEEGENMIEVDDVLPVAQTILDRIKLNEKLNYGSCILLPHVPQILEKIKRKLETKSKNLSKRELFILCRISELVWEAKTSDMILHLLLPVVLKKASTNADEESILQLTTTINNLIKNVEEPAKHLRQFSPLFAHISNAPCRKILCEVLATISLNCDVKLRANLQLAQELITEINAFDAKWLDQPNYTRRLDAFKRIQNITDENKLSLELGILLIYNAYYFISIEKDLSMRESASHCLKTICPNLINNSQFTLKENAYILDETLLNLIRAGLKNRNDDVRNECISLLGHLSRECANSHVVLRDLNKLTNKADLEVDFFENLTHLQTHRHGRAFVKFTQIFKQEVTLPNARSLTQFVLPMATHYLNSEKYLNKHSLVDSAIETVATVCRLLPWHQYEALLRYYLGKLRFKVEHQKQMVKLVVAILDAFHYDLSKAIVVEQGKAIVNTIKTTEENKEKVQDGDEEIVDGDEKIEENEDESIFDVDPEVDDEMEVEDVKADDLKVYDKTTVLCKSSATRVVKIIQGILLPQLHRALAEMTQHESSHKVNRKIRGHEREEEDLLRVPISLAVVKLLQRLPKAILDANLPGVFMKLCTFLKSQLESVRRTARETLQKIMSSLGPDYLGILLGEMSSLLSKGFQVHVLVYTIHSVLVTLKDTYKPSDIDKVLLIILEICNRDLFGLLAEEKEVAKIGSKTFEAKSTKSFDAYQILAQYITDKCIMDLVLPIKKVLSSTHSYKMVNKAQECLRYIALGLVDNTFIRIESLLKFAYGTASESIPQLLHKEKPAISEKEREKLERQRTSCLIIPKEPVGKSGHRVSNVKKSNKANAHILIEFGLRLFNFMLKRDKLKDEDCRPFIDPFVEVFRNCLKSQHVKLSTVSLQCLQWVMKYELPSMEENVKDISESLFGILHKYAAAGLSKGDNFDLVMAAFKAMSVLVRDVKYHTIDADQLKILLLYVEQDLYDHERQSIAFGLLKAIIARKLIVPEIHSILTKVSQLSITSEQTHVRIQARTVFMQYLMDYPLGRKLKKHIDFYLAQLSYELQSGRESALEMCQSIVHCFPPKILNEYSGALFITLGTRLVNDEVPACRKMAADCITSLLTKLTRPERDLLFDILLLWLQDQKIAHRRLAAQLCGIFITVEKSAFESRLSVLTPVILLQFGLNDDRPGKFVLLKKQDETPEEERVNDHHLYQVLQMVLKLSAHCPKFLKQTEDIENIALHIQTLLAYPHDWVRLAAAQFLGFVLSTTDIDALAELIVTKRTSESGYLHSDPVNTVKSLTLDLCAQLEPGLKPDLAEQVIKNLVFIARVLEKVPINSKTDDEAKINLLWMVKRMRKIVNSEVVENPTNIVLRTEIFKWIAGVITVIDFDLLRPILHHFLAPLVREMITTEESNAPIRQLGKEVAGLIKKRLGMESYMQMLTTLQQKLSVKRAERKRNKDQLAVTDPEMYAKKKIKLNEKKKDAKKKKMGMKKGVYNTKLKKRKAVDMEDHDEVM